MNDVDLDLVFKQDVVEVFAGAAELENSGPSVGAYTGAFGGTEAAVVGGTMTLTGDFLVNRADEAFVFAAGIDTDKAEEFGVFIANECPSVATSCFDPLP